MKELPGPERDGPKIRSEESTLEKVLFGHFTNYKIAKENIRSEPVLHGIRYGYPAIVKNLVLNICTDFLEAYIKYPNLLGYIPPLESIEIDIENNININFTSLEGIIGMKAFKNLDFFSSDRIISPVISKAQQNLLLTPEEEIIKQKIIVYSLSSFLLQLFLNKNLRSISGLMPELFNEKLYSHLYLKKINGKQMSSPLGITKLSNIAIYNTWYTNNNSSPFLMSKNEYDALNFWQVFFSKTLTRIENRIDLSAMILLIEDITSNGLGLIIIRKNWDFIFEILRPHLPKTEENKYVTLFRELLVKPYNNPEEDTYESYGTVSLIDKK